MPNITTNHAITYTNFIYLFKHYLLNTYSNLTSQSSRIVDNDSELISVYLHNEENQEGVTLNHPPHPPPPPRLILYYDGCIAFLRKRRDLAHSFLIS